MALVVEIWTSARQGIICANRTASTLKEATLAAAKRVTRKTETLVTVCRVDEMLKYYAHSIPFIIRIVYSNVPIVSRHKRVWPVRNLSETGHLHQYTRQFPVYLPQRVQAWSVWKILHRSERVCGWQHLRARLPGINNIIQLFKILFCLFLF